MKPLKIRKIGNSLGVILPKEMLAELGLGEGDEMIARRVGPRSFSLSLPDSEFGRQMALAEEIMDDYRDALAELAK